MEGSNLARTSTYLNFSRNTEEAFLFYKSVFGGDFIGKIHRFSDHQHHPFISQEDKKLIMHMELPITGGHILMGTDAPESFGFKVNFGNNSFINLEPDTREEGQRLFNALSKDGTILMALQEMPWGIYFGSCSDQFGVQWMINFPNLRQ